MRLDGKFFIIIIIKIRACALFMARSLPRLSARPFATHPLASSAFWETFYQSKGPTFE
jgi:hypothetical protein